LRKTFTLTGFFFAAVFFLAGDFFAVAFFLGAALARLTGAFLFAVAMVFPSKD
jgi:hypothetical protein